MNKLSYLKKITKNLILNKWNYYQFLKDIKQFQFKSIILNCYENVNEYLYFELNNHYYVANVFELLTFFQKKHYKVIIHTFNFKEDSNLNAKYKFKHLKLKVKYHLHNNMFQQEQLQNRLSHSNNKINIMHLININEIVYLDYVYHTNLFSTNILVDFLLSHNNQYLIIEN